MGEPEYLPPLDVERLDKGLARDRTALALELYGRNNRAGDRPPASRGGRHHGRTWQEL